MRTFKNRYAFHDEAVTNLSPDLPIFTPGNGTPGQLTILLTGLCLMRCKTCFGPPYDMRGTVTLDEWLTSIKDFWLPQGIRRITISGGEPLLWRDKYGQTVYDLILGIRALDPDLEITLSTIGRGRAGDKLVDHPDVLAALSVVGVPFYGRTPEVHGSHQLTVRGEPNLRGWHDAVELLDYVAATPELASTLRIEIRSVVTRPTWDSLTQLPALFQRWASIKDLVWCVYEENHITGPVREKYVRETELPEEGEGSFDRFIQTVSEPGVVFVPDRAHQRFWLREPLSPRRIVMPYSKLAMTGKYIFADTDGSVRVELLDPEVPWLFSRLVNLGSIFEPDQIVEKYRYWIGKTIWENH